ncbi:hypothetical protein C8Q80DRAFT_1218405 [Daedaleopsis nitida]|nr:hypothetical protein C8Q80DRAFT_1218405 [Daedaleopsis nitida]
MWRYTSLAAFSTLSLSLARYHKAAALGPRFPLGPDSVLINGVGLYAGGPSVDLAVTITVTQGKRYRHGEPVNVDSIQIYAGQRYSFVLNANQTVDNYWIRMLPNGGTQTQRKMNVAPLVETDLFPLENPAAPGDPEPGGVDYALNLDFSFNGRTFVPPTVPVQVLQILSGTQAPDALLSGGSVYSLPSKSTIELSFPMTATNAPGAPHPFHLHGVSTLSMRTATLRA